MLLLIEAPKFASLYFSIRKEKNKSGNINNHAKKRMTYMTTKLSE